MTTDETPATLSGDTPDPKPTLLERFSLLYGVKVLIGILREMLAEQREANRLRTVYFEYMGVSKARLMRPAEIEEATRGLTKEQRQHIEIQQPTDEFYAQLEVRRQALRARGIPVRDEDDLDAIEAHEQGGMPIP